MYTPIPNDQPLRIGGSPPPTTPTPITVLNRQIYDLAQRVNELDLAGLEAPKGPEEDAYWSALCDAHDQILHLHDEIACQPAQSVEDAAIQATIAFYSAGLITGSAEHDPEKISGLSDDLHGLLASIIQALVRVGGLDIDRLGSGDMRDLCDRRAPDRSAQA
jgi:hypothetical protein